MGSYFSTEENTHEVENDQTFRPHRMEEEQSQSLDLARRLRNPPVTILTEILKEKVKLDDRLERENNAILQEFLDTFIPVMRGDKLFNLLYKKIYYTGSYYSDLRIATPDEYDLNLVLKFPFKASNVSVQYNSQAPSYAKYLTTDWNGIPKDNGLTKLFEDGYLIPDKVRIWLQSVIDRALHTYRLPTSVIDIKTSGSGPARTIILKKRDGNQIDIDFVPAIECIMNSKPPGIDGRVYEKVRNELQCFLVPKPYNTSKQPPVNKAECARLWRTHYPDAEAALIHDVGCVKPIIKLLKLLRDKEDWKILASYYLKTIVMWMVLENSNPENWKLNHIGERFLDALKILAQNVKEKKIRYFFSSRYNLLEKLTDEHASNIYHRLCAIVKMIEKDPVNLWKVFGCRETFSLL